MRKNPLLVLLALVLSAIPVLAGPASADPTEVRVHAGASGVDVRKGHCNDAHVRGYGNWDQFDDATVKLVVRAPGGAKYAEREFINRSGSFDRSFRMCYGARTGIYTVAVTVIAVDELGTKYWGHARTSYRMDRVIPKKNSRIALRTGRVSGEGEFKYAAIGTLYRSSRLYPGRRVWLIARSSGTGWLKIDSSRTGYKGAHRGRVGWYFKPNDLRWAMVFEGDARTRWSGSDTFRFPSGRVHVDTAKAADIRSLVRDR